MDVHVYLAANVALHFYPRSIIREETDAMVKMDGLIKTTAYRLRAMHEANYHKEQLPWNSSFPLFSISTLLLDGNIITKPVRILLFYSKPIQYLTLAFVKSSTSWELMNEQGEAMATKKKGDIGSSIKHGWETELLLCLQPETIEMVSVPPRKMMRKIVRKTI